MKSKAMVLRTALVLAACLLVARPAAADFISLSTALTGPVAGTSFVDVIVDLDLNGAAPNIVGVELYAEFAGLIPINSSYQLGSVFAGLTEFVDYIELHGRCSDLGACNYPPADPVSPSHYLSSINLFPPNQPSTPGGLFSLRFRVDPLATTWEINLFGERDVALTSERVPECDFAADPSCNPFPPIPFDIVSGTSVPRGTARVTVTAAPGVPEPTLLLLIAPGLAVAVRRRAQR
jgi:hypothetical protein